MGCVNSEISTLDAVGIYFRDVLIFIIHFHGSISA